MNSLYLNPVCRHTKVLSFWSTRNLYSSFLRSERCNPVLAELTPSNVAPHVPGNGADIAADVLLVSFGDPEEAPRESSDNGVLGVLAFSSAVATTAAGTGALAEVEEDRPDAPPPGDAEDRPSGT